MSVELATAYVSIVPSASDMAANLSKEMGAPLEAAARDAGEKSSKSFAGAFALGAAAAAVAVVVGLEKIGSSFDDAGDKIRTTTGATGAALEGLNASFKNVVTTVPADFGDASAAIAGFNQKLGLTGKPLEDLSGQVLNLSRITGTDLAGNVKASSDLFNSWGTAAADQGPKLDELFRISQATGISVTDLATQMAEGGIQFRAAGLSFEESGALLGLLAKNGLSAADVLPAISKAMASAAKDGKPAAQVFRETFDAIKNAPNDTAAAATAFDVFGAKAGPKFAALIREGKLSYDDLAASIAGGGDTINNAASDTDDWREKLQLLINQGMVALEPIATKVFGALGTAMDAIPGIIDAITTAWDYFIGGLNGDTTNEGTGVLLFLNQLGMAVGDVVDWFKSAWPDIRDAVVGAVDGIVSAVSTVWDWLWNKIPQAIGFVVDWFKGAWPDIRDAVVDAVEPIITAVRDVWDWLWEKIPQAIAGVVDWFKKAWPDIRDAVVDAVDGIVSALSTVWDWLWENIPKAVKSVVDWFKKAWPDIRDAVVTAAAGIVTAAIGIKDGLVAAFEWLMDNKEFLIGIAAAIGVGLVAALVSWTVATWAQVTALWAQAAAFVAANAPIAALGIAIAALVGGVIYAYNHFEAFRNIVDAVGRFLRDTVWPIIQQFAEQIRDQFAKLVGWVREHWDQISAVISAVVDGIKWYIELILSQIMWVWDNFGGHIMTAVKIAWDYISGTIETVINIVKAIIEVVTSLIQGDWEGVWQGIKDFFSAIWDGIMNVVQVAIDTVELILSTAWTVIKLAVSAAWDAIKAVISLIWDGIKALIQLQIDLVIAVMSTAWDLIKGAVQVAWDAIKAVVGGAIDAVKTTISDAMSIVKSAWDTVWGTISAVVSTVWDTIKGVVQSIVDFIKDKVDWVVGKVEAAMDLANKLNPFSTDVSGEVGNGFPGGATGIESSPGGPTWVGERGPELLWLNRGAFLKSNPESMKFAHNIGGASQPTSKQVVFAGDIVNTVDLDGAFRLANFHMAGV